MAIFLQLFIYMSISFITMAKSKDLDSRIIYGDPVKIEDTPFFAGLPRCGAVIISDTWILTAAHCVEERRPILRRYVWVGGETFDNSQRVLYSRVIIHQNYTKLEGIPVHDIALIKLIRPLKFSRNIQPILLPVAPIENSKLVVVGRGTDETGKASKVLKKLDLMRLSTEECLSIVPKKHHEFVVNNLSLFESMNICAKRKTDNPTICFGDSGGPLVSGDSLVGIVSYIGGKRCRSVRLGFYVNVTTYVPWIKEYIGLD